MIWLFTIIALIGTVLNARMNRFSFIFWIVSNGAFTLHNLNIQQYEQASLFGVYLILAVYGFFNWKVR